MLFHNRADAGQKLAQALAQYKDAKDAILLALPRGGLAVAEPIAQALHLPLDIVVPRKIGAPGNEEFAIGAITEEGEGIFDEATIAAYQIPRSHIDATVVKEQAEARRRLRAYRGGRPPLVLEDKTVILIDDGLATGLTMRAAIKSVRARGARAVIVAVPVSPPDTLLRIQSEADEVFCLETPAYFGAVGQFYDDFPQVTDNEVITILQRTGDLKKSEILNHKS